ncbi:AraC family transcriptional regulator [Fluviicola sp.]|jgi:AraC-like DNA-binding protein|uniref:helix-turn-helix domain-containing protein n=1 Tax=Fluviicola sp. TaxID=1917219 RepID=UPI002824AF6D|nr:AraC family transcriptional regulator [Fluviicola sp.]MDR0801751.1 AraC family transcriptional regulator [Fluviicola sp.]
MDNDLNFKIIKPDTLLTDFVESFWMLQNHSDSGKEIVVLPDGRIDLFFSQSATEPFHITLSGLETQPDKATLPAKTIMFAISFKLLATEYIFQNTVSNILNYARPLPVDFWGFNANDLNDFDLFCKKASQKIQSLLPQETDNRKRKLFDLIYLSNGTLTVNELSENVFWSNRQINRYFNRQYGISLKVYCNILRFRASLEHIAEGKLFPEQNFTDQNHFIKDIKKFSGVVPKELSKNKNDRFLLLSAMKQK